MNSSTGRPVIAEQVPINQAIARGLVEVIPDHWEAAEPRLEFTPEGVRQDAINPDTEEGWTVSDKLMMAVLQLDDHRRKFNLPWKAGAYTVRLAESGQWRVSASFT